MPRDYFSTLPRLKGPATVSSIEGGSPLNALSSLRSKAPSEWERILRMPVDPGLSKGEVEEVSRQVVKPEAFLSEERFRLLPNQAWCYVCLNEIDSYFGNVDVGQGKTFMSLLAAAHYWKRGHKKILLCIPPEVWEQLANRDIPEAKKKLHLNGVPFIYLSGLPREKRNALAASGVPGCYILPYSLISASQGFELLLSIAPTAIILDEAHRVSYRNTARTKRLFEYIRRAHPHVSAMSGTMTQKGLMDYHHTLVSTLGINAPVPLLPSAAKDWAAIVDAGAEPNGHGLSMMAPLISWAQRQDPIKFKNQSSLYEAHRLVRLCYQERMNSAPGVITAGSADSVGTSLYISNRPAPPTEGHDELVKLMKVVSEDYETPNGDPIDHAIHTYSWMRQLSSGFWYKLHWPSEEDVGVDILDRSRDYHTIHNEYLKGLRSWLQDCAEPSLDTPLHVASSMDRVGAKKVGVALYDLWQAAKSADFPERVERLRTPVRVCDYKVQKAVEFGKRVPHGIVWYEHQELGSWIVEDMIKAGLSPLHCPAGKAHNLAILDSVNRLVVASIGAHAEGKNLQFHRHQHYSEFPRKGKTAQQVLGRLHRYGQKADELIANLCLTSEHDHMCYAAMLMDSLYVVLTQGLPRKVIFASYDPLPKSFPPEVLLERGFHGIMNLPPGGLDKMSSMCART